MGCYCWESFVEAAAILLALIYLLNAPAALAGVGATLLCLPPITILAKKFAELRNSTAQCTDRRVRHISEVIDGIATVKSYVWETPFFRLITKLRAQEVAFIAQSQVLRALNQGLNFSIPAISSFVTFTVFWSSGGRLTIPLVFAALSLLQVLRHSVGRLWTRSIEVTSEAVTSCHRLGAFLDLVEKDLSAASPPVDDHLIAIAVDHASEAIVPAAGHNNHDEEEGKEGGGGEEEALLDMLNCSFRYSLDSDCAVALSRITLSVKRGELLIVVGPVGCGKSTLLLSILGEVHPSTSRDGPPQRMRCTEKIAYCAQRPWIMADSVRNNILLGRKGGGGGGEDKDEELYAQAVEACLIVEDLSGWPGYDLSEVGERGISISGGQKARLSLARAVYADADCEPLKYCI
jgi:ATP-binding cassette subfamily C (CFTR/MRP) protein 4